MLIGLTAVTIPIGMEIGGSELTTVVLIAAAPSLIIQAVVLRCVYGREGRRWFEPEGPARVDPEP